MVTRLPGFESVHQARTFQINAYRLAIQALGSIEHQSGFRINLAEMSVWLFDRVMQEIRTQLGPTETFDEWVEFRWHSDSLVIILT